MLLKNFVITCTFSRVSTENNCNKEKYNLLIKLILIGILLYIFEQQKNAKH